ncbi:hypothetical protein ASE04_23350 [Rhizobium sp. Root708]|uniref:recombination regulator RecX n=1 Tax=Rhizobium sp. Root708 TaxID=1736592 RepID=UPI0006F9475D|nr:recombination regulator RecX [Rhizobium sp. Root708]KRB60560.1 hypothetical protein ASE04_23350 [Rhizobium sp. Root708]
MDVDETETAPTARMLQWARNSTIYRVQRKMMSEHELKQAILRKAREKFEGISAAQLQSLAEEAVAYAYRLNALDDVNYAELKVRSAVRSGKSKKAISQKLAVKGVDREIVGNALEEADDFLAALNFARKRGFGPYRRLDADDARRNKELSAFARGGFSLSIGRRIFEMTRDEAEELLLQSQSL